MVDESLEIIKFYKGFNKITTTHYEMIKYDLERLKILEEVIKVLKDNLYITFNNDYNGVSFKLNKYDECDYTILCLKDKQQYNLLKEVLNKYGRK